MLKTTKTTEISPSKEGLISFWELFTLSVVEVRMVPRTRFEGTPCLEHHKFLVVHFGRDGMNRRKVRKLMAQDQQNSRSRRRMTARRLVLAGEKEPANPTDESAQTPVVDFAEDDVSPRRFVPSK